MARLRPLHATRAPPAQPGAEERRPPARAPALRSCCPLHPPAYSGSRRLGLDVSMWGRASTGQQHSHWPLGQLKVPSPMMSTLTACAGTAPSLPEDRTPGGKTTRAVSGGVTGCPSAGTAAAVSGSERSSTSKQRRTSCAADGCSACGASCSACCISSDEPTTQSALISSSMSAMRSFHRPVEGAS
jgi:hypothetical protein